MQDYYEKKNLDPSDFVPETYLIPLNEDYEKHPNYCKFQAQFKAGKMWWIFKPGEATNRGNGIKVLNSL